MIEIDTTKMCSHLYRKLFSSDGEYHKLWLAMNSDPEVTAVVRNRQLHVYRNAKKIMVLAGKAGIKEVRKEMMGEEMRGVVEGMG